MADSNSLEKSSGTSRLRRFFKLFCGAAGIAALACIVGWFIWSSYHGRRIARLIDEIRSRGEPVEASEITASFPLPAGVEDVAELWLEGLAPLDSDAYRVASERLPFTRKEKILAPKPVLAPEQLADAEAFLRDWRTSLEKFHEAARRGGHAKFSVDYSHGIVAESSSPLKAIVIHGLVRLELEAKWLRSDIRGAARCLKTLLIAPRCLEYEPTLPAAMTSVALTNAALKTLAEKTALGRFSEEELREFQSLLRSASPKEELRRAYMCERAFGYTLLRNPERLREFNPWASPYLFDVDYYLEYMTNSIRAFEEDFPKCSHEAAKIGQDLREMQASTIGKPLITYTTAFAPINNVYFLQTGREIALLRAADIGVAVELYRRRYGELPESLQAIASQFESGIPIDPFDAKSMRYRKRSDGFVVYSVGANLSDEEGDIENINPVRGDYGLFFPMKTQQ